MLGLGVLSSAGRFVMKDPRKLGLLILALLLVYFLVQYNMSASRAVEAEVRAESAEKVIHERVVIEKRLRTLEVEQRKGKQTDEELINSRQYFDTY